MTEDAPIEALPPAPLPPRSAQVPWMVALGALMTFVVLALMGVVR